MTRSRPASRNRRPSHSRSCPLHRRRPARAGAAVRPEHRRRSRSTSARPARAGSSRSACCCSGRSSPTSPLRWERFTDRLDAAILRQVARLRTRLAHRHRRRRRERLLVLAHHDRHGGADRPARGVQALAPPVHASRLRGRAAGDRDRRSCTNFKRPRPFDVTIIGRLERVLVPGAGRRGRSLVLARVSPTRWWCPGGRARSPRWSAVASVIVGSAAGLYLATYHPFDLASGIALAVARRRQRVPVLHPERGVPGRLRRREDGPPRRRRAARRGDPPGGPGPARPHGLDIKPVGLAGSGGSTPLRLRVAGDPDTYLFGKLYAMNHVRADRWYKLGRTILYGRLEDEAPFQSVRRLVAVRGLHAAPHARRRASRRRRRTASSSSRPSASTCSSPSSSTARRRSATPRSTTTSSTRAWRSSASSGTPGSPTATSSRPTCWCSDGHVAAHRRRLRAGAPVAVAPGGRPRQHDAGPRGAHRRRARVRAGAAVLHARRDRRGVRRRPRRRQPDAAAHGDEAGRPRPGGPVPRARAAATPDLAAALERQAGGADPGPRRRRPARRLADRVGCSLPATRTRRRRRTRRRAAPAT